MVCVPVSSETFLICFVFYWNRWWIQSKKGRVAALIAILVGVVLVLAAGASLVYWHLMRYRDKATAKYNNLDEVGEEETLMSDETLLSDQL